MKTHREQISPRQPVASSSLTAVGYDSDSRTLEVEFRKGGVYRYLAVPASVHQLLMKAPSKGRYLAAGVKNRFPYARVSQSAPR